MRIKSERGVTLIELLAAITIMAFVIGLVTTLIYQSNLGYKTITSREFVQEHSRMFTEHLVNQVRAKKYTSVGQPDPAGNQQVLLALDLQDEHIRYLYDAAAQTISVEIRKGSDKTVMKLTDQIVNTASEKIVTVKGDRIDVHLKYQVSNTNVQEYRTTVYVPSWQ
ncbi:PilW family protein [Paenibacillus sp. MBLB4367]|uniref:PilW family protein n=1 Tax=Paenibacillus sp. MBLB4367 TaxID=3384767 RepID=UPI0039081006